MTDELIEVYTTFDHIYQTWNVLTETNECLFHGSIDRLEEWLDDHSSTHIDRSVK